MKKDRFRTGIFFWAVCFSALAALPAPAAQTTFPEGFSLEGQALAGLTLEEAKAAVQEQIESMAGQPVVLEVRGERASATAADLGFRWENEEQVQEALREYEDSNLVRRYMLTADYQEEPVDIRLEASLDEEALRAFVEENCRGLEAAGQDASIVRENGQFYVTPEVTGVEADIEATVAALQEAAEEGLDRPVMAVAVTKEELPQVTAQQLETIQDVLGTFSTDFSSSGAARSTNLSVGAEKIDGHVLLPGETLSGYECLQPFTVANGYQTAAAYENGQVVDSIGGGVCQIATTLYNAALLAELEITQRQNHSMSVSYVQPSQDAAIAGTYKDIKITNPYDTPIYVEGYTEGRRLYFTIYGQETRPAGRQIRFESETLSVTDPGMQKEVLNPALEPGSRKQVQAAHKGIKSRLWKVVLIDGVETERTILTTDTYNASPAVIQVGPPLSIPVLPEQPSSDGGQAPSEGAGPDASGQDGTQSPMPGTTPSQPQSQTPESTSPQSRPQETTPSQPQIPESTQPQDTAPLQPQTPEVMPSQDTAPLQPQTPEVMPSQGTAPLQPQTPETAPSQTLPLVPETTQPRTWAAPKEPSSTASWEGSSDTEGEELPSQPGRQLVPTVGGD